MKLTFGNLDSKLAVAAAIQAQKLRKKQLDQATACLRGLTALPDLDESSWHYPVPIRSLPLDVLAEANVLERHRRGLIDPLPIHASEQQKQAED